MNLTHEKVRTRPVRTIALAALIAAFSAFAGGTAGAEPPPPYHYDTTGCENTYFLLLTTAERVQHEVPAPFAVLGAPAGIAIVGVMFTSCEMTLNGEDLGRVNWSDVGVLVDPPDSIFDEEPKIHIYRTWSVGDSPEMVALNEAWGVDTAVTDVNTTYAPGLPIATSSGFVESSSGDYAGHGTWGGVVHQAVEGTVTWWNVGPAGVARFDQAFTNDTEQCGGGVVTGEGRLGAMIGGSSHTPHGCITFADLIGTATLVEPAE